ncbi:MAG TPA: hypothetical protein VMX17_12100 [Candidatus Glassbacteria bacterium]|nr:hypothetical protein [Candidatus Glassbacteria bacterium]
MAQKQTIDFKSLTDNRRKTISEQFNIIFEIARNYALCDDKELNAIKDLNFELLIEPSNLIDNKCIKYIVTAHWDSFSSGIKRWEITTDETFKLLKMEVLWSLSHNKNYLHNIMGPTRILFYPNGKIKEINYYKDNKRCDYKNAHGEIINAVRKFNEDGTIQSEESWDKEQLNTNQTYTSVNTVNTNPFVNFNDIKIAIQKEIQKETYNMVSQDLRKTLVSIIRENHKNKEQDEKMGNTYIKTEQILKEESADDSQQKEESFVSGIKEEIKSDAIDATWRAGTTQAIRMVRDSMCIGLEQGGQNKTAEFLKTPHGELLVSFIIGVGLPATIPIIESEKLTPKISRFAKEARVRAEAEALTMIFDPARDAIFKAIQNAVDKLPEVESTKQLNQKPQRVEDIIGIEEVEEEIVCADGERQQNIT